MGQAVGQKTPESEKTPSTQVPIVIPVAEVATRATEVSSLLLALEEEYVATGLEVEKIQKEIPGVRDRLELRLQRTMNLLQAQTTMEMLRYVRSWIDRRNNLDLAAYDLMRVVTTELRRLLDKERNIQL